MDFDDEDFDDDFDNEAFERNRKEESKRLKNHPLFKQANEILQILEALTETSDDTETARMYTSGLRDSAVNIIAKLSGAIPSESYLVCMQSAAIIRDQAEHLRLSSHLFKHLAIFDDKYILMFREEMENFRLLFKSWATEIHTMENNFEDEWGLFLK